MSESSLTNLRHSLAHLLAAAVMDVWPDTKRTIGPAIEDGFYFDFQFAKPISEKDLSRIEKKMREILPTWKKFERHELTAAEAKKEFADNPFKLELIDEIVAKGEPITFYKSGDYWDLCRGGHAVDLQDIDPAGFTLTKLAGAYWRGDETKPQLQRIYGLAFESKAALEEFTKLQAEAKKRDHKVLGPALDLFTFSPLVGSGLPLWTPKGTLIRDLLDDAVWQLRRGAGYERVDIPHITKKDLYERSGHWDKFKDELFKIETREGHVFAMKPMNCPHHAQLYARRQWSYRELPQRYASTTKVYRDEQTGELAGLSRVRSITQDDAHVFCRLSQAPHEIEAIWKIINEFYGLFNLQLSVRLSLSDPAQPEKYLGDKALWKKAEQQLRDIIKQSKVEAVEAEGEAAFYGPKIDFIAEDSLKRQLQVATIQLDLNQPERFDLTCINEKGEHERIVMIHAAIMGSIERFLAALIEHTGGNFPLWLAPVQVGILPVSERHLEAVQTMAGDFRNAGIRVWVDESGETVGKKIRTATKDKIPYLLVVGDKELAAPTLAVRTRGSEEVTNIDKAEFVKKLQTDLAERRFELR